MSAPGPRPDRAPLWPLVIGCVAVAIGIFSFLRAAWDPTIDELRWLTTWLWLLVGAFWIWQWRRMVGRWRRSK